MKAVLYIAHGSKSNQINKEMRLELEKVTAFVDVPIQHIAFLEVNPTIKEGIEQCIKDGATEIIITPVFLLPGVHVITDIPNEVESAQLAYSDIKILISEPLAASEQLVMDTKRRVEDKRIDNKKKEAILLVSHGSRYEEANEAFQLFKERLEKKLENIEVYTSYLKSSQSSFETNLTQIAADYEVIYVVPHFFSVTSFPEKIEELVTSFQQEHTQTSLVYVNSIDINEEIIKVIVKNIEKLC